MSEETILKNYSAHKKDDHRKNLFFRDFLLKYYNNPNNILKDNMSNRRAYIIHLNYCTVMVKDNYNNDLLQIWGEEEKINETKSILEKELEEWEFRDKN